MNAWSGFNNRCIFQLIQVRIIWPLGGNHWPADTEFSAKGSQARRPHFWINHQMCQNNEHFDTRAPWSARVSVLHSLTLLICCISWALWTYCKCLHEFVGLNLGWWKDGGVLGWGGEGQEGWRKLILFTVQCSLPNVISLLLSALSYWQCVRW